MYPIHLTQSRKVTHTAQRGFTLIELMIVIAMMMLVIALVAPMGVNMVDKAKAQTEYIQLQGFLKKQSTIAFVNATPITLTFRPDSVDVQLHQQNSTKTFEHLTFSDDIVLHINRNGLYSSSQMIVMVGNINKTLNLDKLVG